MGPGRQAWAAWRVPTCAIKAERLSRSETVTRVALELPRGPTPCTGRGLRLGRGLDQAGQGPQREPVWEPGARGQSAGKVQAGCPSLSVRWAAGALPSELPARPHGSPQSPSGIKPWAVGMNIQTLPRGRPDHHDTCPPPHLCQRSLCFQSPPSAAAGNQTGFVQQPGLTPLIQGPVSPSPCPLIPANIGSARKRWGAVADGSQVCVDPAGTPKTYMRTAGSWLPLPLSTGSRQRVCVPIWSLLVRAKTALMEGLPSRPPPLPRES